MTNTEEHIYVNLCRTEAWIPKRFAVWNQVALKPVTKSMTGTLQAPEKQRSQKPMQTDPADSTASTAADSGGRSHSVRRSGDQSDHGNGEEKVPMNASLKLQNGSKWIKMLQVHCKYIKHH